MHNAHIRNNNNNNNKKHFSHKTLKTTKTFTTFYTLQWKLYNYVQQHIVVIFVIIIWILYSPTYAQWWIWFRYFHFKISICFCEKILIKSDIDYLNTIKNYNILYRFSRRKQNIISYFVQYHIDVLSIKYA